MGSSAPLQGEWPFSAVIVIFILMIKSLYAMLVAAPGLVAGVS